MGVEHPDDLRFAFRSERLVFRALEDNDDDKKFIFDLNNDPISAGMGSLAVLKPASMAEFEKATEAAKTCRLFVVACLPPFVKDADGKDTETRMAPRNVTTGRLRDATPIGFVAVWPGGKLEIFGQHRCGSLSVGLLTPFTGKKYGGDVINWTLDWAFRRANLHRVELAVMGINANAIKLYRSLGFVEEGRDREAAVFDRKWVDLIRFGMLEGEWEKLRGITSD
ncbi:acyl-CoA N-acyltransferase [Coniochaeta ligniaria NRRL 30616]|uniref:Acyl-CoA N-acyltransferase n=1 Tax=Coniochaeta ligniaria NRRL 30616 TaxID=1408157 RepID=A0A1J7IMR8_9PEZI|nr:acyl-CoA N-acyltransferase [Coniochaeta ligniaria NRRL 30616]